MNKEFIETFIEVYNEMQKDKCDTGEEAVAHDSITKLIPFLDENKISIKEETIWKTKTFLMR